MHKMSNNNNNNNNNNSDAKYTVMSAVTTADTSTLTADRIEWSRSTILSFIEDYRQKRVLWDPNTKGYHIKQTKYEALKILGQKYGTEIRSIRSKIKSLRSSFHREHGKVLNGRRKGVHYQPMWFAYEAIRFILDGEPIRAQQQCNGDIVDGESGAEGEKLEEKYTKFVEEEQHVSGKLNGAGANPSADSACKKEAADDGYGQNASKMAISTNAVAAMPAAIPTIPAVTQTLCCLKAATTTPTVVTLMPMTAIPTTATTATTRTYAYADDNSFAARVAGIGVGVAGMVGRNNVTTTATTTSVTATATNEEFAAARSDNDSDLQTYCNISAEDVKTEIIEGDITDLSMCERQRSATPPSSFNFYKQAENAILNKKRNSHILLDRYNDDGPGPSKQQKLHEHSNLQANQCDTSNDVSYANKTTTTGTTTTPNDEYGVFGEYVAITIRKLKTSKAKIVVKHLINNLLYEAELGKYDQGIPSTREPPQLYKM